MPLGYHRRILRVDLSTQEVSVEEPGDLLYRRYLGGSALACYLLLRELKSGIDPLSPENVLVFSASVLCGTALPGASRYTVAAKSPLTSGYGEAEAGGWWGPELKSAGYDAVLIKGRARNPVYLWIHDGEAEIRDAGEVWGMSTGEAQEAIRKKVGESRARVALIGPAGENLVRYACILNELKHANGRTGMGAVMGSKNLKGVAVRGTRRIEVHDQDTIRALARYVGDHYERQPGSLHDLGTARGILPLNQRGILPTRNFIRGTFDRAEEISGERMKESILTGRESCFACPIRCKRQVHVEGGIYATKPEYGGPEYETIASFGSLCCIDDLKAISKAHELCQTYGLDTISTGVAIAFAMECYEKGILARKDTDGLEISFGSKASMLTMIERIARREGFGDILAEGVMRAASKIRNGAEQYAHHVKGQELPLHEPRGKTGLALAYALSPTGADHCEAAHDPIFEMPGKWLQSVACLGILEPVDSLDLGPRKLRLFMYLQQIFNLYNSVGMCNFVGIPFGPLPLSKLIDGVNAATGWETSLWELLKVGERAGTMARVFNTREGLSAKDDTLPERFFSPLEGGLLQGVRIDKDQFRQALKDYYQMAGWDPDTGIPTKAKLEELDLGEICRT